MVAVVGEISAMFDVLGAPKDDARIVRSLESSSGFREQDPFVDPARGEETLVTMHNRAEGYEYRFVDGLLNKVVIHAQHEANWAPYPRPTDLIAGLDISAAGAADVEQVLGQPWKSDKAFLKYKIGDRYLHISFLNEKISRIVVMAKPR